MAHIEIRSVEDLLVFMAIAGNNQQLWEAVDTATLKAIVPIAIKGPTRDGRLDIYGATFVADLQRQTYQAFRRYGGTTAGGRANQLRVEVKDGSDWLNIDFSPAIKEAVKKMTPTQIVGTICFGAVLAAGVYCYGDFKAAEVERIKAEVEMFRMEHQERMIRENNEHHARLMEQLQKSNADLVTEAIGLAKMVAAQEARFGNDTSKPIRKFVKTMRRGESLKSGDGEEYSKKEAVERLIPPPAADTVYYVHADGNYSLHGVELLEGIQGLRIAQEEGQTTGLLERLDTELKENILAKVDQSLEEKAVVGMDLQVDVYFTQKKIHHAVVIGVGKPRAGLRHWQLGNIPGEVPEKDRLLQGEKD